MASRARPGPRCTKTSREPAGGRGKAAAQSRSPELRQRCHSRQILPGLSLLAVTVRLGRFPPTWPEPSPFLRPLQVPHVSDH